MNEKPALSGPWPGKERLGVLVFFGKKNRVEVSRDRAATRLIRIIS